MSWTSQPVTRRPGCMPDRWASNQRENDIKLGTVAAASLQFDAFPGRLIESDVAERAAPVSELDRLDGLVRTYRRRLVRFVPRSTRNSDLAKTITQASRVS
jgi:hypothetical protein